MSTKHPGENNRKGDICMAEILSGRATKTSL
jgi:hypothetical protein